ncbi:SRPBCC family protein [Leucobacter komagatae]|uniref:Activator of Hsp90 ATPase homologue 1/2-like C-terminal domain-containing protein n=1 Tax=Leucobacter komagatae TaxID=55969 RepID=A0A0D0H6Q0_9MICO|nr:SRPBCC domain-containing protein [Leucobacter komagatae]KIP52865.1 hypothetical protein SD72_06640 [Leucobacter komagatae]
MSESHRGTIEVDEFVPHKATRVWAALTDARELGQWFMSNDFQPEVGHEFTLDTGRWGVTYCTVLEVDAPRRLRYSWRNGPLDTIVTWSLVQEGAGTRILIEHRGFDTSDPLQRQAYEGMAGGWRSMVLRSLAGYLAA